MESRSGQMDRKTKTSDPHKGALKHPYRRFEATANWRKLSGAIDDLVRNKDIVETTRREYIVGYLCQALSKID